MKSSGLKQFLYELNLSGYASGEERQWIKQKDDSTTIPFAKGKFRSDDNFFGGEPYGGRIIVFYEEKPVWIMVYYGAIVKGEVSDIIYKFLRESLKLMPKNAPYRGPKEYKIGNLKYLNSWNGDIKSYNGCEKIYRGDKQVYSAKYIGGLVDIREGV